MRVSIAASVLGLLAAFVAAQGGSNSFNIPAGGYDVQAGKTLDLSWGNQAGSTVTIKLQEGANFTPGSGVVLASSIPNTGSTTVSIPGDVSKGYSYTIEIINNDKPDDVNFTNNFQVNGATNTANPATATSTGASSSSSGSSSSSSASSSGSSSTSGTSTTLTTSTSSGSSSSSSTDSSSTDSSSSTESSSPTTSSESASASSTAQATSAPGAGAAVKAPAGLMVAVLGAAVLL